MFFFVFYRGDLTFGDYKQEEEDCNLSRMKAKMGLVCPRAYYDNAYFSGPNPSGVPDFCIYTLY